jgi:vacuolar iron transporter family protein
VSEQAQDDGHVAERLRKPWRGEVLAESVHALTVEQMRQQGASTRADAGAPGERTAPRATGVRQRLDRILGREKWHRRGGGWIFDAIYGANDGLASVFGIVAGVSGATGGSSSVPTAGLSGAIASALSMATGAFMAEHPDAVLQALCGEEIGVTESTTGNPAQSALPTGVSTGVGAIIPVIPFMCTTGTTAIAAAAVVSLLAHFLVGAAKSLVTLRTWWSAGLEIPT